MKQLYEGLPVDDVLKITASGERTNQRHLYKHHKTDSEFQFDHCHTISLQTKENRWCAVMVTTETRVAS